jgi:hypothetical protein
MTAFIGWIDSNVGGTPIKVGKAGVVMGANMDAFAISWTKKTTDVDGSLYFLTTINADALIHSLKLNCDSISGLSSASIGLFNVDPSLPFDGGPSQTLSAYYAGCSVSGLPNSTPVDAGAIFMALTDISGGSAEGSERDALANLVVQTVTTLGATTAGFLNYGKKIWELLGFSDPKYANAKYAIGMKMATAGSASGNLCLRGAYVEG